MSLFVGSVCWKCDIALCMIDNTYMLLTFHKQQLIFLPFQLTILLNSDNASCKPLEFAGT